MSHTPAQTAMFAQIEAEHRYMIRYATAILRDEECAREVVQEATLAALDSAEKFSGDSTVRTWLTSILKFKIIDFQRRSSTERQRFQAPPDNFDGETDEWIDSLFDETGHWRERHSTWAMPEAAHEQTAFFGAFERCMDKLPAKTARVFFRREVLGDETEDICKEEGISSSNCWVILHRARVALQQCLEHNWFGTEQSTRALV
jgi:RNA polymerase sigma-70 factor, ECF subfamily